MGIRNFYFSANNYKLREEWKTLIEFIRAKAIYNYFVKFFPLIKSGKKNDDYVLRDYNKNRNC